MSRFQTIEVSDPRFSPDGMYFITVKSNALNGRGDVVVQMPDNPEGRVLPLVILLHGVYGSSWAWAFKGGAHRTLSQLIKEKRIPPMILVMPSDGLQGDGTGYVSNNSADYEQWILETREIVPEVFKEVSLSKKHFICGLSMGGYGALRIASKYPYHFLGVSAHSSVVSPEDLKAFIQEPLSSVFPGKQEEYNLLYWLKKHQEQLPAVRFDCGLDDTLLSANRTLHQSMLDLGIGHLYQEFAGGHEWPYWERHLVDSLLFFGDLFLNEPALRRIG